MEKAKSSSVRQRLSPEDRRQMIIDGAIRFFSENGFDGSTYELAKDIGVTQPLIYKYFASKDGLISAVYDNLFASKWSDEWDAILADRSRPLGERLEDFYIRYCNVIHSPEWMRVFLYSGLKGTGINKRYATLIEERAIRRICMEARAYLELPSLQDQPISDGEFEAAWLLHGGIFYYGVRRFVYEIPVQSNTVDLVRASVTLYLEGVSKVATQSILD